MTKPSILDLANSKYRPPKPIPHDTQQVCIDLPGETVRCVVYKPKLEIILKKHRDVVFDISLFKGMTYTVKATQSDFYNARDKKIVLHKNKQTVSFSDGERLHLWVSRDFKGELLLSANGKVLGRYSPNMLDPTDYGIDPAKKPAPLLVIMNNQPTQATIPVVGQIGQCTPDDPMGTGASTSLSTLGNLPYIPLKTRLKQKANEDEQTMHVVEIEQKKLPEEVWDFFKHGGEETAIDDLKVVTRNFILNTTVTLLGVSYDAREFLEELSKQKIMVKKIIHKKAGAKYYIIFKGWPGERKYFTAAKYGVLHPKVLSISGGVGSLKTAGQAAWTGVKNTVRDIPKGSLVAIFFTMTLDVAEWIDGYLEIDPKTGKPKKDVLDLMVKIGMDVLKMFAGIVLGAIITAVIVAFAALFLGLTIAGSYIVIGGLILAGFIGYGLEVADAKNGATKTVNKIAHDLYDMFSGKLHASYDYLEQNMSIDYGGYPAAMKLIFTDK